MSNNISFNPLAWAIRPLYEKAIAEDKLFAQEVQEKESRKEKPKSLAECADYILGEAYEWASNHRQGNMGFAGLPDSEVENLIKHYYDEENIVIKKIEGATAKVATSKEKTQAKAEATGKIVKMETKPVAPAKKKEEPEVPDLFAGLEEEEEDDLPE